MREFESKEILALATTLARHVGARIASVISNREKISISHKGAVDLVTEIDIWSEGEIRKGVQEHFPEHKILGEESAPAEAAARGVTLKELGAEGVVWVVDPLDGTTNFSNGIPYCAVSIAILRDGVREIGVVYDPCRDEMFHAIRGQGAFLNGAPIACSEKSEPMQSVIASAFPYNRHERWGSYGPTFEALILSCRNVRLLGAAALDICWVAMGRFDGFFEFNLKPWDIAAASLIVQEANGDGMSFMQNGEEMPLDIYSGTFLFSGKPLLTPLRNIIQKSVQNGL